MKTYFIRLLTAILSVLLLISCSKNDPNGLQLAPPETPVIASYKYDEVLTLSNGLVIGRVDSLYVMEGDILVSREQLDMLKSATKATVLADFTKYWNQGCVYYKFAPDFSNTDYARSAMNYIARTTGITFTPATANARDILYFVNSTREGVSSSYLGCIGGVQEIKIDRAASSSTIVHELCHALGFNHEQCRQDRDDYVVILGGNIEPGDLHNFDKNPIDWGYDIGPFDFNSIMLYHSWSFSVNKQPTMVKKYTGDMIYSSTTLSEGDVMGIQYIYGPPYVRIVTTVDQIVKDEVSGPFEEWEIYYDNYAYFYEDKNCTIPCITTNKRVFNVLFESLGSGGYGISRDNRYIVPEGVSSVYLGRTISAGQYEYGEQRYYLQESMGLLSPNR